jgi:hypothetical protein
MQQVADPAFVAGMAFAHGVTQAAARWYGAGGWKFACKRLKSRA